MTYEASDGREWPRMAVISGLVLSMALLSGCPERRGPLEQVGHDVDQAAQGVSDDVDHAVHDVQHGGH